jgi:hypothetical protein
MKSLRCLSARISRYKGCIRIVIVPPPFFDLLMPKTRHRMVVHHAGGLHRQKVIDLFAQW